jgi:hypothetical protein
MQTFGMLRRVALVRTEVSEECRASIIRVTRIGELGTTLAVTSNRRRVPRKHCNMYFNALQHLCTWNNSVSSTVDSILHADFSRHGIQLSKENAKGIRYLVNIIKY